MNLLIYFLDFLAQFISVLPLIAPISLLHFLGFLDPFTLSLSLLILVGLLTINLVISAYQACFLIPLLFSLSHLFYIVGLLLLLGPLSKVGFNNQVIFILVIYIAKFSFRLFMFDFVFTFFFLNNFYQHFDYLVPINTQKTASNNLSNSKLFFKSCYSSSLEEESTVAI